MGRKNGGPPKAAEGRVKAHAKMAEQNRNRRVWSQREVAEHMEAVEQLLAQNATEARIAATMREAFQVGSWRTGKLVQRVRARWDQEDRANRGHWKAEQIRSIKRTISRLEASITKEEQRAEEKNGQARVVGLYNAKARHSELLAAITGTLAPLAVELELKMEVHVQQSVLAVVATMTPEQMAAMMDAQEENERLALAWRQQHGEVPKALPVTVESPVDGTAE